MNVKTRNIPKKQSNMTTDKQKAAVHFCEKWLNVTQVSNFLYMEVILFIVALVFHAIILYIIFDYCNKF